MDIITITIFNQVSNSEEYSYSYPEVWSEYDGHLSSGAARATGYKRGLRPRLKDLEQRPWPNQV